MRRNPAWFWLVGLIVLYLCLFNVNGHLRCRPTQLFRETFATSSQPREAEMETRPTIHDFIDVTLQQALQLEGKLIMVWIRLNTTPMKTEDKSTMYSFRGEDNLARSVIFSVGREPRSDQLGTEVTIEGRLQVRFHDSWKIYGQVIPAYVELRLIEARNVEP
jgi:hypothetical protein